MLPDVLAKQAIRIEPRKEAGPEYSRVVIPEFVVVDDGPVGDNSAQNVPTWWRLCPLL